jgi:hypothetical protein
MADKTSSISEYHLNRNEPGSLLYFDQNTDYTGVKENGIGKNVVFFKIYEVFSCKNDHGAHYTGGAAAIIAFQS